MLFDHPDLLESIHLDMVTPGESISTIIFSFSVRPMLQCISQLESGDWWVRFYISAVHRTRENLEQPLLYRYFSTGRLHGDRHAQCLQAFRAPGISREPQLLNNIASMKPYHSAMQLSSSGCPGEGLFLGEQFKEMFVDFPLAKTCTVCPSCSAVISGGWQPVTP